MNNNTMIVVCLFFFMLFVVDFERECAGSPVRRSCRDPNGWPRHYTPAPSILYLSPMSHISFCSDLNMRTSQRELFTTELPLWFDTAPKEQTLYCLSYDLAKLIERGDILRILEFLRMPAYTPTTAGNSPVDDCMPPELDRSNDRDLLLLSVCLHAPQNGILSFCFLLEHGADPDARGLNGRFVEWDFDEKCSEHSQFREELEEAQVAKFAGKKHVMSEQMLQLF